MMRALLPDENSAWYIRHAPLMLLAALVALGGCSREEAPSPESTGDRVISTKDQVIRFAYQDRVADAVSIVAMDKGFFREAGLTVKGLRFSSGPACSEALYSGSADVGTMGDTTAVIAVARHAPVLIAASHGGGEHRHRIVVGKDSPIRTIADLKGKRIAVKKGTSTYGGLLAFLQANHLSPKDVVLIDMRPADMIDALLSGSVDALVASEPTPCLAETRGAKALGTLGGLGNTYPILLMMRQEFPREHPEEAKRFIEAMRKAAAFVREHPEQAAQVLAKATGLSPDVAAISMKLHRYTVGMDPEVKASLDLTAGFLLEQKIIATKPDLEKAMIWKSLH